MEPGELDADVPHVSNLLEHAREVLGGLFANRVQLNRDGLRHEIISLYPHIGP